MKGRKVRFLAGLLSVAMLTQSVLPTRAASMEINCEPESNLVTVSVEADEMLVYQKGRFDIAQESDDDLDMSGAESFYDTYSEAIEELYQQLKNETAEINLSKYNIPTTDISDIVWGCVNEHPDLYDIEKFSYTYFSSTMTVASVLPTYIEGYDDDLFEAAVNEALLVIEPGMTDLEKAIALHDYIIMNCQYNYDDYLAKTLIDSDYSAYGILALKEGVCNGYALAYKYLCNLVGIECYMVSSESMNHAWNLIKLNGQYYQVDATWDDPTWDRIGRVRHFYMFSSDADFIANREHSNWTVTHYNVAVDLQATDKIYDDYYWMDIDSAMIYDNHNYYYIDSSDVQLKKINTSDMTTTNICSLGRWNTWEGNGYWPKAYSGLFEWNNRLYFNKSDGIYSVDPNNTSDLVKEADNPKASEGRIYGCALQQGEIKYTVSTTPNMEGAWPVYTLQLQNEIEVPVSKVVLNHENIELILGSNTKLEYEIYPTYAVAKQVTWSSNDENIATVDNGVVTPVGEGTCRITVTVDGVSASCEVKVVRKAISPVFTPVAGNVDIGEMVEITAEEGAVIYYTLDGSEPTVASNVYTTGIRIEEDTVIKAIAVKAGYENSDITTGTYIACSNKLELFFNEITLKEGEETYLHFTEIPTTKTEADITVSSADESIATVDEEHCVRAVAPGQTVITASVQDHKGRTVTTQVNVTVEPLTYMVYFKYYNEQYNTYITYDSQEVAKGGSAKVPEGTPPAKDGYKFVGWDGDYTNVQGSVDIYAIFGLEEYSITYNVGKGSNGTGNPDTYTIESEDIVFADAVAPAGYTFEGWYWDERYKQPAERIAQGVSGNKTLYARYVPITYSITYELKDGMNSYENIYDYTIETQTFVLKDPTGCYEDIFIGWYEDDDYQQPVTQLENGSTGNKTFWAKWQLAKPVFSKETGEILKGQSVSLECPRTGAKIYYTTDGTTPDANALLYSNPVVIDREMTIKAITVYEGYTNSEVAAMSYTPYEVKNVYTVQFLDEKGNLLKEEQVEEGSDATPPQAPEKVGYRFAGWSKATTNIQRDEIILPFYEMIRYHITYIVNGGNNDAQNPDSYTIGDSFTLKEAKDKTGFVFNGWYLDEECQGNPITEMESGRTGDITLYAGWRDERGLWMEEIAPMAYTGKKVQPTDVKVYDGSTLLQLGKDYTISYKNNINANDLSSKDLSKAPAVVVTGKGNYAGKVVKNFVIEPKNIEDTDVQVNDMALVYKKNKVQKPVPKVVWNGKTLKKNKDFTVTYENDTEEGAFMEPGEYTIWVKGNGNYSGTKKVTLTITSEKVLMSKVKVVKIPNQEYTGNPVNVEELLKLTYKGDDLTLREDYELDYEPCVEVGTHKITIHGKENFIGTIETTFKINGRPMNKVRVSGIPSSVYYTGNKITTEDEQWTTPLELSYTVKNGKEKDSVPLTEENYEISYKNHKEKGTAQIIFTGKKGYTGTLKKTFKILAYDIGEDEKNKMDAKTKSASIYYEKNGAKPEMVVTFGEIELIPNKDYTVSYKNNKAVNSFTDEKADAVAIIKGKGNYSGKMEVDNFEIVPKNIETVNIEVADLEEGKAGKYKSIPKLTDKNGKKLVAGVDYDKDIKYFDAEGKLLKNEKIEAGNTITVTVYAKENGNYTGEISTTYRIVEKGKDISKAKATLAKGVKLYYTGSKVTLNKEDLVVKLGGTTLSPEEFKIAGYSNNVEKGTATVTIEGLEEYGYGGRKQIKFKIQSQKMKWWEKL